MAKINEKQSLKNQENIEAYKGNELLFKKIIKIAQYESELELGVNPSDFEQAKTYYLTEIDFEYIRKVTVLVEKRLIDSNWLTKTIEDIESKSVPKRNYFRGIRFDDELFKAGRGFLETFLNEKYNKKND